MYLFNRINNILLRPTYRIFTVYLFVLSTISPFSYYSWLLCGRIPESMRTFHQRNLIDTEEEKRESKDAKEKPSQTYLCGLIGSFFLEMPIVDQLRAAVFTQWLAINHDSTRTLRVRGGTKKPLDDKDRGPDDRFFFLVWNRWGMVVLQLLMEGSIGRNLIGQQYVTE